MDVEPGGILYLQEFFNYSVNEITSSLIIQRSLVLSKIYSLNVRLYTTFRPAIIDELCWMISLKRTIMAKCLLTSICTLLLYVFFYDVILKN